MKKNTKRLIALIMGTTLVLGSSVFALASGNGFQSVGRFEYKTDPSASEADVVIDSADLTTIYNEVKDGKTALATSINTATGADTVSTNVNNLPTFEQLSNAIDHVKQAGVDEAYHQIATSPNLDSGTYGSVTDLASLESAITQDNNNLLANVQADPDAYGITGKVYQVTITYTVGLTCSSTYVSCTPGSSSSTFFIKDGVWYSDPSCTAYNQINSKYLGAGGRVSGSSDGRDCTYYCNITSITVTEYTN